MANPCIGQACHYCGEPATTRDHVVPRSRMAIEFRQDPKRISKARASNVVASCAPCNQEKADQRSTCDCRLCTMAWLTFGPAGWPHWRRVDPTERRHRRHVAGWQFDTGR